MLESLQKIEGCVEYNFWLSLTDTSVLLFTDNYTSELLDKFTLGIRNFLDVRSKYVCHTSTILFLTTIDMDFLRKNKIKNPERVFCNKYHGESHRHLCSCIYNKNYCQFVNAKKEFYRKLVSACCLC